MLGKPFLQEDAAFSVFLQGVERRECRLSMSLDVVARPVAIFARARHARRARACLGDLQGHCPPPIDQLQLQRLAAVPQTLTFL